MITRKQCQICTEYKVIKNKDISRCPNADCDAFNCESCLEQWYKEKNECPICHTVIGDIKGNLEVEVEELRNVENVEDSEITCFCRCYPVFRFTCYHINSQNTKEAFELILCGLKITLVFLIVGFISYNIIALLSFHSIPNVINETKNNYLTASFYLVLISLGMVTIGICIAGIGIIIGCFSCNTE